MKLVGVLIAISIAIAASYGQSISTDVPKEIDTSKRVLIYLHGGVVQQQGAEAVSEYYGRYEYDKILEELAARGFHVISEIRAKDTTEEVFSEKLKKQIEALLKLGLEPERITVVGASLGAYIAIETAYKLKNKKVRFALLGLCSDYAVDHYRKYRSQLIGDFLSIYEKSDEKGSCRDIFTPLHEDSKFREIQLDMGNSHAFLFKPHDEWILPLVEWK